MDKTRWCLHIWPKEYTNGIHMEYYLAREEVDSGPEFIRVAFELSFLDSYGIQLVKKSREATFTRDKFKGFSEFVEQAVVYTHRRHEYLPEDTLTACCRMRRIGGPSQKPVICSATSVIGVERNSFDWDIENFSIIRPGRKRSIQKSNPSIKIQLTLTAKPEEALQFEISHAHMDEPNMTDCEISVMNASKHVVYSKKDSRYLEGKVWKFPIFLKKSQLTAEKNVCLRKDILALKCNISISLGVISSFIDGYRSRSSSLEDETSSGNFQSSSIKVEASSIVEDCPSTANEAISLDKEYILDLKKDDRKLFEVERKNSKEIPEEFLSEDSSSSINEGFSPTKSYVCSSSEDEKVGEFDDMKPSFEDEVLSSNENENGPLTTHEKVLKYRQRTDIFKKTANEMEETREMNRKEIDPVTKYLNGKAKEIFEKFSHEDYSSSMNERYFLTQNEECSSTEDETVGEFNKFDNESFSMEEIVSTSSMKSELQRFYQDGTFSDIDLTVGKETFPAHKLILSLRSLKFKEILMNDLSKTSIKLTDLDSETLRYLLDFIYTNNVENMTWEKAQKLYLAAESYQVTPLKHACYMFMKKNINESNACNVLILADEQQDEECKQLNSFRIIVDA
ncbi:hypothetical protein AVEN_149403-1 [Araneus ventricosus]|uniref:BTB domain-containing protein n=1 Tax=Araneus ventricosus TaxID=182803 RepID=A0A4Y2JJL7_ARAVE|nr:hypothetical protein AVEN_149403-1 [Araneus ventricosus]